MFVHSTGGLTDWWHLQIHPHAFVIQNLENADFVSLRLCFYGDTLNKAKELKPDTSKFVKAFKNSYSYRVGFSNYS